MSLLCGGRGLRDRRAAVLRAEWVKARTVPDLPILAGTLAALTLAVSAAGVLLADPAGPDPAHRALLGVQIGQAVAAIAGVQMLAGESGTGMLRVTLLAVPRRGAVLAAKALLLSAATGAAAAVAVPGSLLIGRCRLPVPLDAAVAARGILHLVLVALLGLGVGAAVRNGAAAVATVLGLLFLMPVLLPMFPSQHVQRVLFRLTPGTAVQALTGTATDLPLRPWPALGVVALWAAAAVALGAASLHRRAP